MRVASLYEQHGTMVVAICRRLLRDANEVEDAAQQTFLSAQRALRNGSRPREPAAWLATIARNECVARTRARSQLPLPSEAEPGAASPDAHSEALRREKVESLRDAIGSLPAQQREAILLREVRGLSYEEVAASLAVSPSAVESLLFRARKGLQLRLRNAWAALSPLGWLASVRDLGAQVVAAGDPGAGPAAAKAVVIGLGAAAIAGGALVGPGAFHRGSPHASRQAPAPDTALRTRHAATTRSATAEHAAPPTQTSEPVVSAMAPTTAPAAVSRPAIFRAPAARSDDGHSPVEQQPGEDRSKPVAAATQAPARDTTTSSDGEGSRVPGSSAVGGGSSQTESEHVAITAPPTFDATSQTGSTVTSVQPRTVESESSDSGSASSDSGSASGGGGHETESDD